MNLNPLFGAASKATTPRNGGNDKVSALKIAWPEAECDEFTENRPRERLKSGNARSDCSAVPGMCSEHTLCLGALSDHGGNE